MLHHKVIGQGKPILMLHGASLDHRYMVDVMEPAFVGCDDWMWVYVDMPGHGQSPARDSIASQDDLLGAIVDFADRYFGDTPFGLVGVSRGSYIARGILHLHPERVTGAALIVPGGNPSADPDRLPAHQVLGPDPALRAELAETELWGFDTMSVIQSRAILDKERRIIAPANALFDTTQEARVFDAFDFSFHQNEAHSVFDKPSLIIAGLQDSSSGYRDAIDLLARFPRASLAVLDMAGHGLAWERPDLFRTLIMDWLLRLGAAMR